MNESMSLADDADAVIAAVRESDLDDASPTAARGPAVCVFCGAKSGDDPAFSALARSLGEAIGARGWSLVYGGGRVGLMGAVADGVLASGGEVVGVIPERLVRAEVAHHGVTRLEEVPDMATRKTRMIQVSDAFIALPGGLGTLDELFEVLTLAQLGFHDKPTVLLDHRDFWASLVQWGRHAVDRGFVHAHDWARLEVATGIGEALDAIATRLASPVVPGVVGPVA